MGKNNIIYGIDLGTTNSLIGCNNMLISSLVSSKVDFNKRDIVPHDSIGDKVVGSYKVDMGMGPEGKMSIEASSIVLETLKQKVLASTGLLPEKVVVSVPAYFSTTQREAVKESAIRTGLELITIINEPTAAAIHVCGSEANKVRRGLFAVYDLGGGTFDCTLIDSRSGKYHVVGTDGCILGGDNLDSAISDYIMKQTKVPIVKRNKLARAEMIETCKVLKLKMQQAYDLGADNGYTLNVSLPDAYDDDKLYNFNLGEYKSLVEDVFGQTVTILGNLIENKISVDDRITIVYVGGSTHCGYLRDFIKDNLSIPNSSYEWDSKPDYTVALGVVKYATSIQNGGEDLEFKDVTKQLSIEDEMGRAMTIIPANTNIPCSYKKMVTNSEDTDVLKVKLYQGNSRIARNNEFIGILEYNYGVLMEKGKGDVEVTIEVDQSGFINLSVEDLVNFTEKESIKLRGF